MDPQLFQSDRVLPSHIRYSNLTPIAMKARQRPVIFTTSNQSTYTQQNSLMRIPLSSSVAFEDGTNTFLKFEYTNDTAAPQRFSNSAHSLIRHFRVIASQGIDLENIRDYWQVHAGMADLLLSPENRYVRQEQGYGSQKIPAAGAFTAYTALGATTAELTAEAGKLRAVLSAALANQQCVNELDVPAGATVTICLPLELSASLGSAQKKLLPLFLMGELTIEIELNPYAVFNTGAAGAVAAGAAPITFKVQNVELHTSLIEFDGSVNMALTQMVASSGLYLHGCTWTTQFQSLAASHNTITCNEKLRSLKSLYFGFVPNGLDNAARRTCRHNNWIKDYQIKIGSEMLPSYSVRGFSNEPTKNGEFVVELLKSASEYSNSMHTGLINCDSFANNDNTISSVGRSLYGCNTDAFDKQDLESGISTIENSPITVKFDQSIPVGSVAIVQDGYVMMYHDIIWSLSPSGQLAVSR